MVRSDSSDQLLPLAGPWIWVARPVVNVRPSSVHTAPVSPQGGDGDSVTVTAFCEDGSIRICHWSSRPSLRR